MPFGTITLNDGSKIPQIGFGTWKIPKDVCVNECDTAIEVGFDHIDSAQGYQNEEEVGKAIKESGLSRKEIWITTKWSGRDGKNPRQSCEESLAKIGVDYVDLYLVHNPRLCNGDIPGTWRQMEEIYKLGYAKTIGVSNFSIEDLKVLLHSCSIRPVVNQILIEPYVIEYTQPLLDFMAHQHIVPEGYSCLRPLTSVPGGPVDKPMYAIAERLGLKPEQVLLAWAKYKGAIILTTSSKKERLINYLGVGDIDLTEEDVKAIDEAGIKGEQAFQFRAKAKTVGKYVVAVALMGYAAWRIIA